MDETLGEKVKKQINYSRQIPIKFPPDVYDEFRQYANEHAAGCFWLAIKRLLELRKLQYRIEEIEHRIFVLENLGNEEQTEDKETIKTFGKGEKK